MKRKIVFALFSLIDFFVLFFRALCQQSCQFSFQCPLNQPICGPSNSCIPCVNSTQCNARNFYYPICVNGSCVNCTTSSDCNFNPILPICYSGICYSCQTSPECYSKDPSFPICAANGSCQRCNSTSQCNLSYGANVICDLNQNSTTFGTCLISATNNSSRYTASLILVIVVCCVVGAFALTVLAIILVVKKRTQLSRARSRQRTRQGNTPVTFTTQQQTKQTKITQATSPIMNKLTFPNSNTPLPPRTLTFTVESEEASEEESDDAEENATSHENEGDGNEIGDVDDNGNKNDSGHLQDNDNETSDSYGASKRTPHRQLGDNTANQKSSPPTVIKQESGHSSSGQNDNDNDNGSEELDSIVEDEP